VSAAPARRGRPKPPSEPKTPRVVELLRKALEWQALLESGEAANQAAIARREGITRARVTQVMGLLSLSPDIQHHILSMPNTVRRPVISERALRPIAQLQDLKHQTARFKDLVELAKQDAQVNLPCAVVARTSMPLPPLRPVISTS